MSQLSRMYLPHEHWSKRYSTRFYTVRLDHFKLCNSPPENSTTTTNGSDDNDDTRNMIMGGNTNHPAYYYSVEIFCGRHEPKIVFRRYSQFKWLWNNITVDHRGSVDEEPILFPPASKCLLWCSPQNDEFAKNRLSQLREFLRDALNRRDVASNPAVAKFLELDSFSSG